MHDTPTRRRAGAVTALGLALSLALAIGPLTGPTGAQDRPAQQTVTTLDPPPPACPAEEGDARFVRYIYLNILFRCPSAADTAYWTGRLAAGYGRGAFAKYVDLSTENLVHNNVRQLYLGLLDREPTSAELTAGVAHIRRYQSDAVIIADILASDEYYDIFGRPDRASDTDEAWLDHVYGFILDRGIDQGGLAHWSAVLGEESTQATRRTVTRALERSREATVGWIYGVYFAGLHRPPGPNEFGYWQQWLLGAGQWRTFQMWTSVLSSAEGYRLAQTQPSPESLTATPEGKVAKRDVHG
ncbi:MAG TPA: DUF4214 domain-containing protein [Iamia sp.]|nr:DUF4214 domain-containing protein [Iamia sp.]